MNSKDLLEEFFIEQGYRKLYELEQKHRIAGGFQYSLRWSMTFSKGEGGDLIKIRGIANSPFEIEIRYNCLWFEKVNLHNPESLDCLKKALDIGKWTVDRLAKQTRS